ncbi:MAG: GH32 C-terminal domain-containing protein [Labilibaculum sp.]|nr:GH32 C-terminal domain-containing protein [Labilibaculum sp.]MBI9058335.1 GH32 C-terminal domain-containing protein [Labilibaculum sp.]
MRNIILSIWIVVLFVGCNSSQNRDNKQIHFGLESGILDAPVLLFYEAGIYHLYYKNRKASGTSVNIAHAFSKDLLTWEKKETSIFPEEENILGTAIVQDKQHCLAVGTTVGIPLLALLIEKKQNNQMDAVLKYSLDNGLNWTKYKRKPEVPNSLLENPQDPSVFWSDSENKWMMSIAVRDHIEFYSSNDFVSWDYVNNFRSDHFPKNSILNNNLMFPLGDGSTYCLITFSSGEHMTLEPEMQYYIGSFEGYDFIEETTQHHFVDFGKNICRAVAFSQENKAPILIGFVEGENKSNSKYTVPRTVHFTEIYKELMIELYPILDRNYSQNKKVFLDSVKLSGRMNLSDYFPKKKEPLYLKLKFKTEHMTRISFPGKFGIEFRKKNGERLVFGYENFWKNYFLLSTVNKEKKRAVEMPCIHRDSTLEINVLIDSGIIEFYTETGKRVLSSLVSDSSEFDQIFLFSEKGNVEILEASYFNFQN